MSKSIGIWALAIFLIMQALALFGVYITPAVIQGVTATVAAIGLLLNK